MLIFYFFFLGVLGAREVQQLLEIFLHLLCRKDS